MNRGTVMSTVTIDDRCTACGMCLATCPTGALRPAPGRPRVVDQWCIGCGECVEICPRQAIADAPRPRELGTLIR